MKLSQKIAVGAPADAVWAMVMDIPRAGRCVPGVTRLESAGPDHFVGSLRVQLGPINVVLQGDVTVVARDDATRRASLRVDAKDARLASAVRATIDLVVLGTSDASELCMDTDVQIAGRIGDFGQPLIQRRSAQILEQFAQCLARSSGTE